MRIKPLGKHHLLLVSARQVLDRPVNGRGFYIEVFHPLPADLCFLMRADKYRPFDCPQICKRHVKLDRLVEHQSLQMPVLRHHRNAVADGVLWAVDFHFLPHIMDFTGVILIQPEDTAQDFGAPGTEQAVQSNHFALTHTEADILQLPAPGKPVDRQHLVAICTRRMAVLLFRGMSQHGVDNLGT